MDSIIVKVGKWLAYLLFLISATSALLYFGFWKGYIDTILEKTSPDRLSIRIESNRNADSKTMRLLGYMGRPLLKESSFQHFRKKKPKGVIRVCSLGDSFAYGDEVGMRHDYPSYLQRLFHEQGYDNIQVLNFGNNWYGFSQVYIMWERVASAFHCDFFVLTPRPFWELRDATFNHTGNINSLRRYPGYIHARLVIENNQLRLVAPLGITGRERVDEYFNPVPRWQYLRYDRNPPSIVLAMLPADKQVRNPFYYDDRSISDEVYDIYPKIIQRISKGESQLVLLFSGGRSSFHSELTPNPSLGIGVAVKKNHKTFPYQAVAGHPTAWGQELNALTTFRVLTGKSETSARIMEVNFVNNQDSGGAHPLWRYDSVGLVFRKSLMGYFVPINEKHRNHKHYLSAFRRHDIAALLVLDGSSGNAATSCFLPLHQIPEDGETLVLQQGKQDKDSVVLGSIKQLQPDIAIYKIDDYEFDFQGCGKLRPAKKNLSDNVAGHLWLGARIVANIQDGSVQSAHATLLQLKGSGDYLASIESVAPGETIHIHLSKKGGKSIKTPFLTTTVDTKARYMKVHQRPAMIIKIIDGIASIVDSEG